jgi:hypothetical protein
MVQRLSNPHGLPTDFDHHVGPFPTQFQGRRADRPATGPHMGVRTHVIRQVVVLEVAGRLGDVIEDLDRAVQLALADGPRGVVCDLSATLEGAEPGALEVLGSIGRHGRDWPGIPVAVACPDPRVRAALAAHPLGRHLIVTASILPALHASLATPVPAVEWLRLAPHPTAPRAARDFVTRTLLDWGLGRLILSVGMVVSELVASSSMHSATDIDLSVAWDLGALRLTVRDKSPNVPRQRYSHFDLHGRGLSVVAGLSRAFGVLPTADGGKVVWAVLNAAPPRPSTSSRGPEPATALQESPAFNNALGSAGLSLCAGSSPHPTGHPISPTPKRANTSAR